MKLSTVRKYNFRVLYSGYTMFTDPATGAQQRTYQSATIVPCWIVNNALGELSLHTNAKLQNDGYLTGLLDKDSELVYPIGTLLGATWRILEGSPMIDSFGKVFEYKYRCLMVVPKQGSVTDDLPEDLLGPDFWNF